MVGGVSINNRYLNGVATAAILTITLILLTPRMINAAYVVPDITPAMQDEQYWISKLSNGKQTIMNRDEIAAFNKLIIVQLPTDVYDLTVYPQILDKNN